MSHPPLGVTARATVKRVLDGDTLEAVVHWPITVRLKDCWAPEIRGDERPDGLVAKAHLQQLISGGAEVAGTSIVFNIASSDADNLGDLLTFGRVVGHVWTPGESKSLSARMVEAGMATESKRR